jgi:hypothetical protein
MAIFGRLYLVVPLLAKLGSDEIDLLAGIHLTAKNEPSSDGTIVFTVPLSSGCATCWSPMTLRTTTRSPSLISCQQEKHFAGTIEPGGRDGYRSRYHAATSVTCMWYMQPQIGHFAYGMVKLDPQAIEIARAFS